MIVPLDGSRLAERALPMAKRLAQSLDAELVLLTVFDPTSNLQLAEDLRRNADHSAHRLAARLLLSRPFKSGTGESGEVDPGSH